MAEFQTVLFDLDGTITDSAPGITNSVKYALKKANAEIPSDAVLRKFIGPPLLDGFRDYCGFDRKTAEQAVADYREYYRETGIFENAVYDGISALLSALNRAGKQTVLATSKPEVFAVRILEHFRLSEYFSLVAGATFDETRSSKDAVIAYALERCGAVDRTTAVMVGDRHHDICGAKANGLQSVGVLYGFGTREELTAAGADYIAADPQELCQLLLHTG